jgi:hypothetical protein
LGIFRGYPPYGTRGFPGKVPGVQWARRQRSDGALIPHQDGQDQMIAMNARLSAEEIAVH